ncbi:hypothetical protein [Pseudomonas sp. NPDC088890]|uniref:hypothetical protein n=1 Tax=Pseudomonas sp. NPDC088890 TaxID=3364458 RepID=UPI00384E2652
MADTQVSALGTAVTLAQTLGITFDLLRQRLAPLRKQADSIRLGRISSEVFRLGLELDKTGQVEGALAIDQAQTHEAQIDRLEREAAAVERLQRRYQILARQALIAPGPWQIPMPLPVATQAKAAHAATDVSDAAPNEGTAKPAKRPELPQVEVSFEAFKAESRLFAVRSAVFATAWAGYQAKQKLSPEQKQRATEAVKSRRNMAGASAGLKVVDSLVLGNPGEEKAKAVGGALGELGGSLIGAALGGVIGKKNADDIGELVGGYVGEKFGGVAGEFIYKYFAGEDSPEAAQGPGKVPTTLSQVAEGQQTGGPGPVIEEEEEEEEIEDQEDGQEQERAQNPTSVTALAQTVTSVFADAPLADESRRNNASSTPRLGFAAPNRLAQMGSDTAGGAIRSAQSTKQTNVPKMSPVPGQPSMFKAVSGARPLAKGLLKRVPGGALVDAGLQIAQTFSSEGSSQEKLEGYGAAVGGLGGTLAGAAAGAAIGSVVPVIGTAIGGLIGGALGSMGGESVGGWLARTLSMGSSQNPPAPVSEQRKAPTSVGEAARRLDTATEQPSIPATTVPTPATSPRPPINQQFTFTANMPLTLNTTLDDPSVLQQMEAIARRTLSELMERAQSVQLADTPHVA